MDMRRAESVVNANTADLPPASTAALDHVLTIVRFYPYGRGRAFLQLEDLPLRHFFKLSPHRRAKIEAFQVRQFYNSHLSIGLCSKLPSILHNVYNRWMQIAIPKMVGEGFILMRHLVSGMWSDSSNASSDSDSENEDEDY